MKAPPASYLPHLASLSRPLLGGALLVAANPRVESFVPVAVVLAACATDWLDGRLARRAGGGSLAGRLVDNACDFALLACVFAFLARADAWTPPVWGRLVRHWDGANWLPLWALLASFGVYAVRLARDVAAGREPQRSPRGHAAGVANYLLAVAGAAERVPGFSLGPWLLEPAMLGVALLNLVAVPENLRLMFHRGDGGPRMPA